MLTTTHFICGWPSQCQKWSVSHERFTLYSLAIAWGARTSGLAMAAFVLSEMNYNKFSTKPMKFIVIKITILGKCTDLLSMLLLEMMTINT